jgi:Cu(I)/Ag(I) efflux system protein CusF
MMKKAVTLITGIVMSVAAHAQALPVINGTVTKIDAAQGKMTIRHEEIPNLDMGVMTMVFKAASPEMLTQVKVGESIRFTADRVKGQITVVSIVKR